MSLTDDIKAFVFGHRAHGTVTTKASEATDEGYDVRLRCTCGQQFEVFVTPEIAGEDFAAEALIEDVGGGAVVARHRRTHDAANRRR